MNLEYLIYISLILCCLAVDCETRTTTQDMVEPEFVEADRQYANVFKSLDGSWKGTFTVYRKQGRQSKKSDIPTPWDQTYLESLDLEIQDQIQVSQHYESMSPYFQKVKIIDTYQKDNETHVRESAGVNKVENGRLWCVVDKPDERVVHQGTLEDAHTIIWSRDELSPLRVEYFREMVLDENYTIVGYGYYGSDDPSLEPVTWFHGQYQRVR